jgi:phage gp36-like protein
VAYAAKADLYPRRLSQAELTQLTDDAGAGVMSDAIINAELTEASGTVDSYCRQRYATPLQTSEQVKGLTLDICVYRLFLRRRRVTDDVRRAFEDAIQFLRDVAAGKAVLDQPVGATAQTATATGGSKATEVEEKFSDDNLKGYV